jgi:hypothetical protein
MFNKSNVRKIKGMLITKAMGSGGVVVRDSEGFTQALDCRYELRGSLVAGKTYLFGVVGGLIVKYRELS